MRSAQCASAVRRSNGEAIEATYHGMAWARVNSQETMSCLSPFQTSPAQRFEPPGAGRVSVAFCMTFM